MFTVVASVVNFYTFETHSVQTDLRESFSTHRLAMRLSIMTDRRPITR